MYDPKPLANIKAQCHLREAEREPSPLSVGEPLKYDRICEALLICVYCSCSSFEA